MTTYTVHEAKTNLSKLLAEMEAGGEVIIARGDTPVARLVPAVAKPNRVFGAYKGQATIGPEFFEPMTEEELAEWEDGPIFPEIVSDGEAIGSGLAESPQSAIIKKEKQ